MNTTIVPWLVLLCLMAFPNLSLAFVHSAPVIIKGSEIRQIARFPISMYQVFKTDKKGVAEAIPFQIDEINKIGDYVVDQGSLPNKETGDGRFDFQDELVFMGDDIGELVPPKSYKDHPRPNLVFELKTVPPGNIKTSKEGAVYVAVYFDHKVKLSDKFYAVFDPYKGVVETSRYRYNFDQQNYLVVRGIDVFEPGTNKTQKLVNSSTMYMRADLKYFLTLTANHRTLNSTLEAWKQGPVRAIVKVSFFYRFLRINFELGMYTEVSFFANAVILPAIMYNPVDGTKSLNKGSGFYYGFALAENPDDYTFETNMPYYNKQEGGMLNTLLNLAGAGSKENTPKPFYWASVTNKNRMLHMEIEQEKKLVSLGNIPNIYKEDVPGSDLTKRSFEDILPLGKSPVNLGMYFDLTKFSKDNHNIAFRLYFENRYSQRDLDAFRSLRHWQYQVKSL